MKREGRSLIFFGCDKIIILNRSRNAVFFRIESYQPDFSIQFIRIELDQAGRMRANLTLSNFTSSLLTETAMNDGNWHKVRIRQVERLELVILYFFHDLSWLGCDFFVRPFGSLPCHFDPPLILFTCVW